MQILKPPVGELISDNERKFLQGQNIHQNIFRHHGDRAVYPELVRVCAFLPEQKKDGVSGTPALTAPDKCNHDSPDCNCQ
jgi:hypothetical protein